MTSRPSTPRPIRRAAAPREPHVPAGVRRVLDALKPWRHLMKPGSAELLAISQWADLQALNDLRRLDEEVLARIMKAESRRWLIAPASPRDRVGELPGDRPGRLTALYRPPTDSSPL